MFITKYIIKFNLYVYITKAFELGGAWAYAHMAVFFLLCMALPYMIGSVNFGVIISKCRYHDDIRKFGSGNAGATNMLRVWGGGAAGLTLFCDMLKCFAAVVVGALLMGDIGAAVAGLFCVVGHVFPCWHRFRGGKGVASTAVVALAISPVTFGILIAIFVLIVATTKYVSLASIMCALLFPLLLNAFTGSGPHFLMAFCASVIVLIMHRENMKRLLSKAETQIDFGQFTRKRAEAVLPDNTGEGGAGLPPREKKQATRNTSRDKLRKRK